MKISKINDTIFLNIEIEKKRAVEKRLSFKINNS